MTFIVVYDDNGDITGFDNDIGGQRLDSVLETYSNLSKNPLEQTYKVDIYSMLIEYLKNLNSYMLLTTQQHRLMVVVIGVLLLKVIVQFNQLTHIIH